MQANKQVRPVVIVLVPSSSRSHRVQIDILNSAYSTTRFAFTYAWWSAYGFSRHVKSNATEAAEMELIDQEKVRYHWRCRCCRCWCRCMQSSLHHWSGATSANKPPHDTSRIAPGRCWITIARNVNLAKHGVVQLVGAMTAADAVLHVA